MQALRFYGQRDLRLVDVDEPTVVPGSVKIAVQSCGICGSDVHEYLGGPVGRPFDEPHPRTGLLGPVTMGHESVGVVVDVGEGVEGFSTGQRVVTEALHGCGSCHACRAGLQNLCSSLAILGASLHGAMAEYMVVPASFCHVVPESVSADGAVLAEPLAVALRSVARGGVRVGDDVIVFGAGPIGLMAIVALRHAGVRRLLVSEPSPARAKAAVRAGSDIVIDPSVTDVADVVNEVTGGRGVDVGFDTAGTDSTFASACTVVRAQGTIVSVAAWERPTEFNPMVLLATEATLTGSLGYGERDFPLALDLLATGRIDVDWMVSGRIALDDVVASGFDELVDNRDSHIKIVVQP